MIDFNIPFRQLMDGLQAEVEKKNVARVVGTGDFEGLEIFNYTDQCQYDRAWNFFTTIARGLVLCPGRQTVVARPFPKFFNWSEPGVLIPRLPFSATLKLDGSLGIVYYWGGEWRVNTRGRFDSEQAKWATEWIRKADHRLDTDDVYLVEIIYPENRVVVKYNESGLVLLGGHNRYGSELERDVLESCGLPVAPEVKADSFCSLVEDVRGWGSDREGVVVRFENGLRVKIKSDWYIRASRAISGIRPLAIWEHAARREGMPKDIPDEFAKEYWSIRNDISLSEQNALGKLYLLNDTYSRLSDKELGLRLGQISSEHPEAKFLFAMRKGEFNHYQTDMRLRWKFFKLFRPEP